MAISIGIELDPQAVRAVVLDAAGPRPTLRAAHEVACDAADPEALSRALIQLRQHLPARASIVLGIPSAWAIFTTIRPLIVQPARAGAAIQFELQQQLPFALAEAVWHFRWLSSSNGHPSHLGSRLEARGSRPRPPAFSLPPSASSPPAIAVVAMRRSLLEARLACCRRAGLAVHTVALSPLAVLNACARLAPTSASPTAPTTVLRLLTPQSGEWIVAGPLSLQVVPIASPSPELFAEAIAMSWEALRAQGVETAATVQVVDRDGEWLRLQGRIQAPLTFHLLAMEFSAATGPASAEHFAAAFGLALQGVGLARLPLNLLAGVRQELRAQQVRRTSRLISAGGAALTLLFGVWGMVGISGRHLSLLHTLERREHLYQQLRPEIRAMLQQQQRIEARNRQLERLAGESQALTRFLHDVSQALPDHVWLTGTECLKREGVLTARLDGRAASFQEVTQFFERLKSVAKMLTVKPLSTTVTTDAANGKELISFTVQVQRALQ